MNLHQLSRWRTQCLAALVSIEHWDDSPISEERKAYKLLKRRYIRAEERFQQATATLSTSELQDWGIRP